MTMWAGHAIIMRLWTIMVRSKRVLLLFTVRRLWWASLWRWVVLMKGRRHRLAPLKQRWISRVMWPTIERCLSGIHLLSKRRSTKIGGFITCIVTAETPPMSSMMNIIFPFWHFLFHKIYERLLLSSLYNIFSIKSVAHRSRT